MIADTGITNPPPIPEPPTPAPPPPNTVPEKPPRNNKILIVGLLVVLIVVGIVVAVVLVQGRSKKADSDTPADQDQEGNNTAIDSSPAPTSGIALSNRIIASNSGTVLPSIGANASNPEIDNALDNLDYNMRELGQHIDNLSLDDNPRTPPGQYNSQ